MEIQRNKYLDKLKARKNNGFVKVITGIRRCGKSYLLNTIFYNELLRQGVDESHIIKFAFDSGNDLKLIGENIDRLIKNKKKVSPEKFIDYISSKTNDSGMYYLLLDEVQNLGGFEIVLNGYLRQNNIDIYVTGSNSKFLSSDILTEFAGRGDEIHVMPLAFSEFSKCYQGDAEEMLETYFNYGGLPAVALMNDDEQKADYLKTQIKNVYLRDLIYRYNLKNNSSIGELLDILASGISTLTNPSKLSNTFKSVKGETLSAATIGKYIEFMQDAFMIKIANRYDVKGKKYISTPYKIYFEDTGLRNARLNFRQVEETHIMENVIYNELRYRGFNVDVGVVEYKTTIKGESIRQFFEVDFVINKGSKRYYIQSAYDIPDNEKLQQETNSFDRIDDSFKKIIIVYKAMKPRMTEKGYMMIGLKEFLLNENSLDF